MLHKERKSNTNKDIRSRRSVKQGWLSTNVDKLTALNTGDILNRYLTLRFDKATCSDVNLSLEEAERINTNTLLGSITMEIK